MNTKLMKNMKKKKKGFTLVELIIVIAIIAILAAMALPKFGAVRLDAKVSNDVAAAKNIQSAAAICVANGSLATPTPAVDPNTLSDITDKMDGSALPTAKAGDKFSLVVDKDGNVTVSCEGVTLAPATDGIEKAYRDKVK